MPCFREYGANQEQAKYPRVKCQFDHYGYNVNEKGEKPNGTMETQISERGNKKLDIKQRANQSFGKEYMSQLPLLRLIPGAASHFRKLTFYFPKDIP